MGTQLHTQRNPSSTMAASPVLLPAFLQRKCTCGGSAGLSGECSECQSTLLSGKSLQAKLRVGEAGDEYEREADHVADRIGGLAEANRQADSLERGDAASVPQAARQGASESMAGAPLVGDVLSSAGQPLDAEAERFFSARLGHDFGSVRVHADAAAAESAHAINALAYTVGRDIVFGASQYAPNTSAGKRLLAHELTHVVQQGGVPASTAAQSGATPSGSASRAGVIQRQPEPERKLRDLPLFLEKLKLDIGKNLLDNGHHFYQAATLHRDEPKVLEDTFFRYGLGLNVLKTSFRYAGFKGDTADKVAVGTGVLLKGLTFVRQGEFTLDFQVDVGGGFKFETNLQIGVNPKDVSEVRKAGVNIGLVRRF